MFLQNKPDNSSLNNEETNINIINDESNIFLGSFELPFTIDHPLNLTHKPSFSLTYQHIENMHKLCIKELGSIQSPINIILPITGNNEYTLFIPRRIEFICKDLKYYNCYVTINKSEYLEKRYILQFNLYIKKDIINEIHDGIKTNNVLFMNVKDILIFALTIHNSKHKIDIKNIKNNEIGKYELINEYKIKPFNYQLENINWCKNVETEINTKNSILILNGYDDKIKLDSYYILNENILYLSGKSIINPEPLKSIKYFFHSQGGLLCDNTGLGKTLTISIHITDDNTKITSLITDRINIINTYKLELEAIEDEDIILNKSEILRVLNDELSMFTSNPFKLKTNCNLLIVPVRLLQQWETEIKSYLPSTKVFLISTIRDFYKLTLESIDKYTIIIISITFLQNDKRKVHPSGFDITDILWKRVIVDEVHELFNYDANSRRNFNVVNNLKAMFKWGISATPNLNLNCEQTLSFLTNGNYWENDKMKRYNKITSDVKEYLNFLNKYYRYNEIKKVSPEINIPQWEEKIIELEMSNIEKLMYNNATGDSKRMIALCTNYKISSHDSSFSGFATVSELKNRMLEQHTKKKTEHIEKIEQQNKMVLY